MATTRCKFFYFLRMCVLHATPIFYFIINYSALDFSHRISYRLYFLGHYSLGVEAVVGWHSLFNSTVCLTFKYMCCGFNKQGRSHFTTTVGVPCGFWLGSNSKGVGEILSCLSSTDVGVRRSAYYLVVTHQHHNHFVSSLTLVMQKQLPHFDNSCHLCKFSELYFEFMS